MSGKRNKNYLKDLWYGKRKAKIKRANLTSKQFQSMITKMLILILYPVSKLLRPIDIPSVSTSSAPT